MKSALLTRLVRRIVARAGSQPKAAKGLACSQAHIWRLVNGQVPKRIRDRFRESLAKYLRREGMTEELGWLAAAVTDRKAAAFHRRVYRRWLDRAIGLGRSVKVVVKVGRPGLPSGDYFVRDRSGPTLEPMLARLGGRYAKRIETFRAAHAPKHDHDRIELAIKRALNVPLIEDRAASGGVELSALELHEKGLLDSYLRAALRREAILLRRLPDFQRIVQIRRPGK